MAGRQLQLARRDNFFSDPFFSDFMSLDDDEFSKKMAEFKTKSSAVALSSNKEAAHNLQVNIFVFKWVEHKSAYLNIKIVFCVILLKYRNYTLLHYKWF